MEEYCIEACGIGKTYSLPGKWGRGERFRALEDLSFRVRRGEWIGVIGLNGSGKSTLLKILAGVTAPDRGSVTLRGQRAAILELGAGFHPDYTGRENIRLQLLLQGISGKEARDRTEAIAAFAELGDFLDRKVRFYSTGMFMRLAFACMICREPDVLLVDEALSVGDIFFQQKCYERLRDLSARAAIVLVTHDLQAAVRFCTRILVLDRGRLVWDGDPAGGVTAYLRIRQGHPQEEALAPEQEAGRLTAKALAGASVSRIPHLPKVSDLSGRMDYVIEAFGWETDGLPDGTLCREGSRVRVWMDIRLKREGKGLIIGYQILDRLGMEVFGETSLHALSGEKDRVLLAGPGRWQVSFSFTWPQIRDGDYFMTLGLGEGREVLRQTEQCWVNRAVHFQFDPRGEAIHGIFNKPVEDLQIRAEGGEHVDLL